MKILFVITKGEVGGAQIFVLNLSKKYVQMGHNVEVAYGEGTYLENELPKLGIKTHKHKSLKRTNNPFINLLFAFELRNLVKGNNYDAIHLNSSNTLIGPLGLFFLKNKPKTIFTIHGLSVIDKNYKTSFIFKKLYFLYFWIFLKFIDKPVFISQNNLSESIKIGLTKKGQVIYTSIDEKNLNFYDKNEAREIFEQKLNENLSDKFIIGSIGRLAYPKNYEFIIENFTEIIKKIPNAVFVLIGNGPEKEKYEILIKNNKLEEKIFLLGEIENAGKLIKGFDLFVLSSIYEGLSITLIEALFAGVPVLASDVGGSQEIVGASSVYKLNDLDDFLEKISNYNLLFPNTDKNNFKLETMAQKYIRLYSE